MALPPVDHAAFLAVAIATHAVVGYTLGRVAFDRPLAGAIGGVAPDADFLFPAALGWPFVHRGLTHALLVAVLAIAAVAALRDRRDAWAFGAGYLSHLALDSTTPSEVPLLYPLSAERIGVELPTTAHSEIGTLALLGACAVLLLYDERSSAH